MTQTLDFWSMMFVFVLASFIGVGVIRRVSRLLHTPLMSITNAISGQLNAFTMIAPEWGAPATGRHMTRESIVIWRVECGQIVENWIVQDNLTMLRQLGIITDDELATVGTPTVATPEP